MKRIIIFLVSGIVGSIGGYFVGYKVAKKKYLAQADKDVQSVINAYNDYYGVNNKKDDKNVSEGIENTNKEEKNSLIDKDSIDYEALKKYNKEVSRYTSKPVVSQVQQEEVTNPDEQNEKIYLISPDDYNGGQSDFSLETLTYYSDGVLADDDFNIISNINEVVGSKALESFGLYEEDVVYVRNENYEVDYEIVLDERAYADVAPRGISNVHPDED